MRTILWLDMRHRLQSPHTWLVFLGVIALTLLLFPSPYAGYAVVDIQGARGVYNSAWMGASLALVGSAFMFLMGYYLVTGTVEHDRHQGLLPLMLSSRLSINGYLLVKFFSHLLLLNCLGITMVLVAMLQQLVMAEQAGLRIADYVLPYLVLFEPILVLVATITILFEVIPKLASQYGNLGYFFLWAMLSVANMGGLSAHSAITTQMAAAVATPADVPLQVSLGFSALKQQQLTFDWGGAVYDSSVWLPVMLQLLLAVCIMLLAMYLANNGYHLLYHARDAETPRKRSAGRPNQLAYRWFLLLTRRLNCAFVLRAELELLFAGLSSSLSLILLSLSLAALILPLAAVQTVLLPLLALLPILTLSRFSVRDVFYGTRELIESNCSKLTLARTRWLAAVLFLLICSCGLLLRFIFERDLLAVLHLLAFILLLPSMSMLLAGCFHWRKGFELLYLLLWVVGPINKTGELDFIGVTQEHLALGSTWLVATCCTVLLLLVKGERLPWFPAGTTGKAKA
ncbi:hypothetical protein LZP73_12945 [Shewanella sp. AS16]|uniref:hypothetical protein n=1 Tax=Shewanella sp. AS16 TaxID=2907625 RepID=UPI001F284DC9|nr:hypothetical protein [Shewanella sp. AS16]MCE9687098.1 hypothetical protein [Shewanella sp. AS16]